jgi:hypothetical protein
MDYKENTIPLQQADLEKIRTLKTKAMLVFILFGLFFFGIVFAFGYPVFYDEGPGKIFMLIFVIVALGVFSFVVWTTTRLFRKDIEAGSKLHIEGVISDKQREVVVTGRKNSTSYHYFFYFGPRKIRIDRKAYLSAEPGDGVVLEATLASESVLSFLKTKSAGPLISKQQSLSPGGPPVTKVQPSVFTSENDSESYMNDTEIRKLRFEKREKLKKWLIASLLWAIPFFLFYYLFAVFIAIMAPVVLSKGIYSPLTWSMVFVAFRTLYFFKRIVPVQKDLENGKKIMRKKLIREKIVSSARMANRYTVISSAAGGYFYIVTDDSFTRVTEEDFHRLTDNMPAIFHIAPKSGIVLHISPTT